MRCLRFQKFAAGTGAGDELRQRLPALGDLTLAVEWALPELEFEDVRGLVGEPLRDGEEPAECGSVSGFGGDFVGVDIGEFETPVGGSGRGIDFRPEGGQRP